MGQNAPHSAIYYLTSGEISNCPGGIIINEKRCVNKWPAPTLHRGISSKTSKDAELGHDEQETVEISLITCSNTVAGIWYLFQVDDH